MLKRFIKLRSFVNDITHTPDKIDGLKSEQRLELSELAFNHVDWNWLTALECVLRPFEQSTCLISGRSYQPLAISKIVMNRLKYFLSTYKPNEPVVNYLKERLSKKYEEYCELTLSKDVEEVMRISKHPGKNYFLIFIF